MRLKEVDRKYVSLIVQINSDMEVLSGFTW